MCNWEPIEPVPAVWRAGQHVLLVQMAVAGMMGVRLTDLGAAQRGGAQAAFARQIAMYLCRMVFDMSLHTIATAFGRDRTTAAHAIRRIEAARDNPDLDRQLAWLEAALVQAGGGDA